MSIFSPSLHHFFWFLFFLFFYFFKPRSLSCVQVTVAGSPGSGGDEGSQESAERVRGTVRPPPLSRSPLCPGLVCEVGMTIVATFQPTSQGCCGDTVILIVNVVMRREPAPSFFLPSDRTCSSLPCASLPLLLSCCRVLLSPPSRSSLDSSESCEARLTHLRPPSLPPFHLSQLQVWERLPGPSRPAWVFQPFQPPPTPPVPAPPPRSDQFLSLPSPQAQ